MKRAVFFWWLGCVLAAETCAAARAAQREGEGEGAGKVVCVIPVRDDISTAMAYVVRRGVKQAIEAKADLILLDMETNGGRLDSTEEIIQSLDQFKGPTATYVNRKAFSAGAFIAVGTQRIYMAPQSVIGAAAPMMMGPGGGVEAIPETVEAKMNSAVRALVRTSAEKNGHNIKVVEAMIDRSQELKIDGEVINEKGQILTLTDVQAKKEYGEPPKPLFSLGTVETADELLKQLGFGGAKVLRVEPTGAEKLASWLTAIGPLLLLAGIAGVYLEMKTPGFGIPGIVGLVAFVLYFAGGYIAGLSGMEWAVIFVIGLALFILEVFVFPGTILVGLIGGGMMFAALVMAMVDWYPGMPTIPSFGLLRESMLNVLLTGAVALVLMMLLSRYVLKLPPLRQMAAQSASGVISVAKMEAAHAAHLGQVGEAVSVLRPGGKAKFGEELLDVMSQGEMIAKGAKVRIVSYSGTEAIVEVAKG